MNRDLIVEGHYSKIAVGQFRDYAPEAPPVVLLALNPKRILYVRGAPFATEVRSLAEDLTLEIGGEAILGHAENLVRPDRERRSLANAQAQLRASRIRAHAQHAQSLNRSSAATIVRLRTV